MFGFERFNKRIKSLCRHRHLAMESLSQSCTLDMATRLKFFDNNENIHDDQNDFVLKGNATEYVLSDNETGDLQNLGIHISESVWSHDIAVIMGVYFHANEWGSIDSWCGSVMIASVHGETRYCIVWRFIKVDDQLFACVQWFDTPHYEYFPNTLDVSVSIADDDEQRRLGSVLSIKDIVPSRVYILPHPDGIHYNLMRESGYE